VQLRTQIDKFLDFKLIAKYRRNTFIRSLMVSVIATAADYIVSLTLHHGFQVREVNATALGSGFGAIVSFYMNRRWAFKSREGKLSKQAFRYLITLSVGIMLNTFGVFLLETYSDWPFVFMRIFVTIVVGLCVNYPLYKNFVFKIK
jgi:putative flippase GtrA